MIAVLDKAEAFVQVGVTWEQFKAIQQGFESIPNVRLNYCEGELEILGISKLHETLRCILALLLGAYFEEMSIEFFPSGSYSQVVERVTEYQSDLSYCFDTDKDRPDLAIEIVITSGSTKKLKYQRKGVPEVWFWQKGQFTLHQLQDGEYIQISHSQVLEGIDLALLSQCMMMPSKLAAVKTFRASLQQ
jgi:Uma2 family endonuclease